MQGCEERCGSLLYFYIRLVCALMLANMLVSHGLLLLMNERLPLALCVFLFFIFLVFSSF